MDISSRRSHIPILRPVKEPKKQRKRLRSARPKRAAQLKEYSIKRRAFLSLHPYCQVWLRLNSVDEKYAIVNLGRIYLDGEFVEIPASTDVHHVFGRIGDLLLDESHWMAVSRPMHEKIHNNPSWAREKGYLK